MDSVAVVADRSSYSMGEADDNKRNSKKAVVVAAGQLGLLQWYHNTVPADTSSVDSQCLLKGSHCFFWFLSW